MNVETLQNAVAAFRQAREGRYPTQLKITPAAWAQLRNDPNFQNRRLSFNDYERKMQLDGMTVVLAADVQEFELS